MSFWKNVFSGSKPMVPEEMQSWVQDCFEWFDERFTPPPKLILPTSDFFKTAGKLNEETASSVAEDIKRLMSHNKSVELLPLDVLPAEYRHTYQVPSDVGGTYQQIDGISIVRYDAELLKSPIGFISVLSHELMHDRLEGLDNQIPGGEEVVELATDLGCIIAGFGFFQMQFADDSGWAGYLSQQTRAFALALFLKRRGLSTNEVQKFFSPRCNKLLKRAFAEV